MNGSSHPDFFSDEFRLRVYLAGQALAGYLAAHAEDGIRLPSWEDAATEATGYADATMVRLRRPPRPPLMEDPPSSGHVAGDGQELPDVPDPSDFELSNEVPPFPLPDDLGKGA